MHFYSTTGIILFILLHLTEISSTQEIRLENDITRYTDTWVTSIFSVTGEKALEFIRSSNIRGQRWKFVYNISDEHIRSHIRTLLFSEIYLHIQKRIDFFTGEDNLELEVPEIQWNFPENKLRICFQNLPITINAYPVRSLEDSKFYNGYDCDGNLYNFTVTYHGSHRDITYSDFYVTQVSERWRRWHSEDLTTEQMESVFPVMIEDLNSNWLFMEFGEYEFKRAFSKPTEAIISSHPDFLSNPQKYYYLIPTIPYFCFILKRIVIRGLSNFEYFLNKFTTSLLIRNIQGNTTLDYGFEEEPDLELNFQIGTIRLQNFEYGGDFCGCVYVQSKNYTVTRMKSNVQLSDCQSELIVDRLGSALASVLLLSIKDVRICDTKAPLEKIEISNVSDWNTIKESYKGRIPFNDD